MASWVPVNAENDGFIGTKQQGTVGALALAAGTRREDDFAASGKFKFARRAQPRDERNCWDLQYLVRASLRAVPAATGLHARLPKFLLARTEP